MQHEIKCAIGGRHNAKGPDRLQLVQKKLSHFGDPLQMRLTISTSCCQRTDRCKLRDNGSTNQYRILNFLHRSQEFLRHYHVANSPARKPVGLAQREERNRVASAVTD